MALVGGLSTFALPTLAQFKNPIRRETFGDIIADIALWLLSIAAALAVAGIIYGGIRYIVALGNDKNIAAAKSIIFGTLVGLVIVILSYLIVREISNSILWGGPSLK